MPNAEQFNLRSSSREDLTAYQQIFNEIIDEAFELIDTYSTKPDKTKAVKEQLNEAKKDLADVLEFEDTKSVEATKALNKFKESIGAAGTYFNSIITGHKKGSPERNKLSEFKLKYNNIYDSTEKVIEANTEVYKKQAENIVAKSLKTYNRYSVTSQLGEKAFKGDTSLEGKDSKFMLSRTAVRTAAVCYMINHGYTAEQLVDNTQFIKEKQEAYKLVLDKMCEGPNKDHKWVAEQYAKGLPKLQNAINEHARKLDPNKAGFSDKDFCIMASLSYVVHDSTQELDRIKEEFREYVTQNDLGDPEQLRESYNSKGYLFNIQQMISSIQSDALTMANPMESPDGRINNILRDTAVVNNLKDVLISEIKKDPNKPPITIGSENNKAYLECGKAQEKIGKALKNLYKVPENITIKERMETVSRVLDPDVLNSVNYKKLDENRYEMKNLPSKPMIFGTPMISKVFGKLSEKAEAAKVGVWGGSSEYNEAAAAIRELDEPYRNAVTQMKEYPDLTNNQKIQLMRGVLASQRKAEDKINRYLERKNTQGKLDKINDPKTQKRIDVMKKALEEVRMSRETFEAKCLELMPRKKQLAAKKWFKANREIDKIAFNGKKALTAEDKEQLGRHMAAARVCWVELNNINKGNEPSTSRQLNQLIENTMTKAGFKEAVKNLDRNAARYFVRDNGDSFAQSAVNAQHALNQKKQMGKAK